MFQLRRVGRSVLAGIAVAAAVAAVSVAGAGSASAAPSGARVIPKLLLGTQARGAVKDSYIVVLKDAPANRSAVSSSAAGLTRKYGGTVTRTYQNTIRGYAAHMSEEQAARLAKSPDVKYVAQSKRVAKSDTIQYDVPSWGLDRLDQIFAPFNKRYTYPNTASNVHAYVLDTGIRISHGEFGGRAGYGYDFVDNDAVADDCDGHGTHVAGTIGGTIYGVAKQVQLVSVRVLGCDGSGTTDSVIAGIDWVTANAVKPAVVNMSLSADADATVDAAVNASIAAGITYSVAAGNADDDACQYSPSRVTNAITVGASDEMDFRASFTNYGSCVDLFAPGNAIPSAWNTGDTATRVISGTSMASGHVAGAAALALSANPAWTPVQVRDFLVYGGTRRVVRNVAYFTGTTDVMLRVGSSVVPQVTGLRSLTNGKNVSVGAGGALPLQPTAPLTSMSDLEKFTTAAVGDGYYTFASWANGKFVSATNAGAGSLIANASTATDAEKFKPTMNGDGTVSLQAKINGLYVTVPNSGNSPLVASAATIGTPEKFIWASPAAVLILRSRTNSKLITTPSNGASPLIASVTADQGGNSEQFDMLDLGQDLVAFRAHSNLKYVSAASATTALIADGTSIAAGNQFYYYHYGDGGVLFQSARSPYYLVQAANNGASPLIANFDPNTDLTPATLYDYVPVRAG